MNRISTEKTTFCMERDRREDLYQRIRTASNPNDWKGLWDLATSKSNAQTEVLPTLLWLAVQGQNVFSLKEILREGGSVMQYEKSEPLLPEAVRRGDIEIISLLINQGAGVNLKDENDFTALHEACYRGQTSVVKLLLSHGADVSCRACDDETPLHLACQGGHSGIIQCLLKAGSDCNAAGRLGMRPLHYLSGVGSADLAAKLVASGADPNAEDDFGRRPTVFGEGR